MKIVVECSTDQNDPPGILNKVAEISKHITELGFKVDYVEMTADNIQGLMARFTQAETLASGMAKKLADTLAGQQQKIG